MTPFFEGFLSELKKHSALLSGEAVGFSSLERMAVPKAQLMEDLPKPAPKPKAPKPGGIGKIVKKVITKGK